MCIIGLSSLFKDNKHLLLTKHYTRIYQLLSNVQTASQLMQLHVLKRERVYVDYQCHMKDYVNYQS